MQVLYKHGFIFKNWHYFYIVVRRLRPIIILVNETPTLARAICIPIPILKPHIIGRESIVLMQVSPVLHMESLGLVLSIVSFPLLV